MSAVISECGKYRYALERRWGVSPAIAWVMLNPSTADATIDDPTIGRCIEFSRRWGFGSLRVVNLYAYRATDPRELKPLTYAERCGPLNAWHQHMALQDAAVIVAAWGGGRLDPVPSALISYDKPLQCLKRLKDGSPGHPLYIAGDTPLMPWIPRESSASDAYANDRR